jgi:hypothetical protein
MEINTYEIDILFSWIIFHKCAILFFQNNICVVGYTSILFFWKTQLFLNTSN